MKAIETHYKGYRFRSRTEARWAIFFDTYDLQWYYEYEGIRGYLPDFYVKFPFGWAFIEVKPVWEVIKESEWEKILRFEAALDGDGRPLYVLAGPPDEDLFSQVRSSRSGVFDRTTKKQFIDYFKLDDGTFLIALANARGARFEYGEDGTQHIDIFSYTKPVKPFDPERLRILQRMKEGPSLDEFFMDMGTLAQVVIDGMVDPRRAHRPIDMSGRCHIRCPWGSLHKDGDPYGAYFKGFWGMSKEFTFKCTNASCRDSKKHTWEAFVDEVAMPAIAYMLDRENREAVTS